MATQGKKQEQHGPRGSASPDPSLHEEWASKVRNETPLQKLDRNYGELLQELRVAQVGVQILFAFMLTIAFQPRFESLNEGQRTLYGVIIFAGGSSMAFLVGPVAVHRLTFGKEMKPAVVRVAHVLTLCGMLLMLIAVVGAVAIVSWLTLSNTVAIFLTTAVALVLVVCWIVIPLVLLITHNTLPALDPDV